MSGGEQDLGEIDDIDIEAIGEPGHRTFRLLLQRGSTTASLWMEKEQLEQLALIIEQQLSRANPPRPMSMRPPLSLAGKFPSDPSLDFRVGRMAVGFDSETHRFVLTLHPIEPEEAPQLSGVVTEQLGEALSSKIVQVAAAGRPRCPLCGVPIEGKHVCPVANGHVRT